MYQVNPLEINCGENLNKDEINHNATNDLLDIVIFID